MSRGDDCSGTITRRDALSGVASAGLVSVSGCTSRVRSLVNRSVGEQVSVSIKTMPADEDAVAVTIARLLADHLEAVGIDARVMLMPEDELLRDVLINHDFELYVSTYRSGYDPDFLRPLTHSQFTGETGWQNPFGFADVAVDELLEEQQSSVGRSRRLLVEDLQRELVQKQPFSTVVIPDDVWALRESRFVGWETYGPGSPLTYLVLQPAVDERDLEHDTEEASSRRDPLRVVTTDRRVTENCNPIAVEFRGRGTFMELLYDPLVRKQDGDLYPWLAKEWWFEDGPEDEHTVTIELRDGLRWHDGSRLRAEDVAFTYRFLTDTSLGNQESPVPAPHYRGRTSLIQSARATDDSRVELTVTGSSEVVERVLTVPILPEHEWEPLSTEAELAGIEIADGTTEALVWDNPEPIGSGPLQFDRRIPGEMLVLEPNDDHFLTREGNNVDERLGSVGFTRIEIRFAPSTTTAVDLVATDNADATATTVNAGDVPRIGRDPNLTLLVQQSRSFYHVGFNADIAPMSNMVFRRTVASLLDKAYVATEIMDGYGTPVASPLDGTEWLPSDLEWDEEDPELPFLGADGELDEEAAREAFVNAGFRYDDDERLIAR